MTFRSIPFILTYMKKTIECICENCQKTFSKELRRIKDQEKKGWRSGRFCCAKCRDIFLPAERTKTITFTCVTCSKEFKRTPLAATANGRNKSTRNFCSHSCAAKYNNSHKTYGTRRSKLEAYLEQQLRLEFPSLQLICNGKEAIGSELDFYFPQLRLAIELNGIFHYEPIYGADKLERVQTNDQQKYAACNAAGIELCIIACVDKHATKSVKERYWIIVRNLVAPLVGRAGDTNVQVS